MYIYTYIYIILQAEGELEQFLKEEHSFLEYEKLVYKYKELVSELQYSVEKVYICAHAYSSSVLHTRHSLCQHTQLRVHVYIYMYVYIQIHVYIRIHTDALVCATYT